METNGFTIVQSDRLQLQALCRSHEKTISGLVKLSRRWVKNDNAKHQERARFLLILSVRQLTTKMYEQLIKIIMEKVDSVDFKQMQKKQVRIGHIWVD